MHPYMRAMAADPYQTLGVARDASPEDIRRAYRALAKKHHPDLNPGSREAERRFKDINAANDLLSDPEKRGRFDRGEIDAEGQERPDRRFYKGYAEGEAGARYRRRASAGAGGPADDPDLSDIFSEFYARSGGAGGGEGGKLRMRGADQSYALQIPFLDAVRGGSRRITLPEGGALDVAIPPGIEDGQVLRLRGRGGAGWNGGPPGDALIEIAVASHPFFRREGRDVHLDLPVTVAEAVLGARVAVPTPLGRVTLTIPKHSDDGRQLRLRGRGVAAHGGQGAGDFYATLRLRQPAPDAALEEALAAWAARHADENPRAALEAEEAA